MAEKLPVCLYDGVLEELRAGDWTRERGMMGHPGLDGIDGEDGWTIPGKDGISNVAGPAGPQGASGMGVPGLDGEDGEDGWPGAPGAPGVPGAGGSDGEVDVVKAATDTTADTDYHDIPDLEFPVEANSVYVFEAWIIYKCSTVSYGPGFAVDGPASPFYLVHTTIIPRSLSTTSPYIMSGTGGDSPVAACTGTHTADTYYLAHMEGAIATSGNAGTLKLRYRSGHATATITVRARSALRYRKVF
jgi:hypothetical protein